MSGAECTAVFAYSKRQNEIPVYLSPYVTHFTGLFVCCERGRQMKQVHVLKRTEAGMKQDALHSPSHHQLGKIFVFSALLYPSPISHLPTSPCYSFLVTKGKFPPQLLTLKKNKPKHAKHGGLLSVMTIKRGSARGAKLL